MKSKLKTVGLSILTAAISAAVEALLASLTGHQTNGLISPVLVGGATAVAHRMKTPE